jgi:hypothetical protein
MKSYQHLSYFPSIPQLHILQSHLCLHSMIFLSLIPTLTRTIHSFELIFRDTFAHGCGTGDAARDHFE